MNQCDFLQEQYLPRKELELLQLSKFRTLLLEILPKNTFYQNKLSGVELENIRSLRDFSCIPFTTKNELLKNQKKYSPYGNFLTYPISDYTRMHQTSGSKGQPLKILDTKRDWEWFMKCWRVIYSVTNISPEDVVFFAFSFGPFIGFWSAFDGAQSIGNRTLAGGGMTSLARIESIIDNKATYLCCTPTYALRLVNIAKQNGIDLRQSAIKSIIVAGEPGGSIPEVRKKIEDAWEARVFDHSGLTEIGAVGIECISSKGNIHFIESEYIIEVIDPETLDVLPFGKEGELVITNLGRFGSPLIRYRTGDLVVLTENTCDCKRTYCRALGGIKGRKDDMIFIRGNNIYPTAIDSLIHHFPEIKEYQVTLKQENEMTEMEIKIEIETTNQQEVVCKLQQSIHDKFHFRAKVKPVVIGTLPIFEMKAKRWTRL